MKFGAISTALVSSLLLAALAFADGEPTSNKWRIELDGQALNDRRHAVSRDAAPG